MVNPAAALSCFALRDLHHKIIIGHSVHSRLRGLWRTASAGTARFAEAITARRHSGAGSAPHDIAILAREQQGPDGRLSPADPLSGFEILASLDFNVFGSADEHERCSIYDLLAKQRVADRDMRKIHFKNAMHAGFKTLAVIAQNGETVILAYYKHQRTACAP
jgi:hypothetical protein